MSYKVLNGRRVYKQGKVIEIVNKNTQIAQTMSLQDVIHWSMFLALFFKVVDW